MNIFQLSGYKFIHINDLEVVREKLLACCEYYELKGTILISQEGININIIGMQDKLQDFIAKVMQDPRFSAINFHYTHSTPDAFKRLKVKIKHEIITFQHCQTSPLEQRAPAISPLQLKQWLTENYDFILLDTRNRYEYELGTFQNALLLNLENFGELPKVIDQLPRDKPIVMFCTGGIRCEKAGLFLLEKGFKEVFQLEGGILAYFAACGNAFFNGECFVFDNRIALTPCHIADQI